MNTIQITNEDGSVVNYSEDQVKKAIRDAEEWHKQWQSVVDLNNRNRYKVRDFFSEAEWKSGYDGGETTVYKDHVNSLLDAIGAAQLTSKYTATVEVTLHVTVEATCEDEVEDLIRENISVDLYDGDVDDEEIHVTDIEQADE